MWYLYYLNIWFRGLILLTLHMIVENKYFTQPANRGIVCKIKWLRSLARLMISHAVLHNFTTSHPFTDFKNYNK